MTLEQLEKLAKGLHNKANASTGISADEDTNEAMAEELDRIISESGYELEDMLEEQYGSEEVMHYLSEKIS